MDPEIDPDERPSSASQDRPGATSRRDFLRLAAAGGFATMIALRPQRLPAEDEPPPGPPVKCAVVGMGLRGREILELLTRLPHADAVACCEVYPPYLTRAGRIAPDARGFADTAAMLREVPEIEAVFVTTPTDRHREIVEACLDAGRHVYCEAPLAASAAEAKAIARAASGSGRIFAAGHQLRANPHYDHALRFLKMRAVGSLVADGGHSHANTSWRRTVADSAFLQDMNWQLDARRSLGLFGEAGVHAFDTTLLATQQLPHRVTAFGSIMKWDDGRTLPDTVQCVFEFPSGFQSRFEATLANSYGGTSYTLNGTHGAMHLTESRCWLFKEADAPSLGWEVYAARERVGREDGIVLVANASKLLEQDMQPGEFADAELQETKSSLESAVDNFLRAVRTGDSPACGAIEGVRAVAMAEAAQRALEAGRTVEIDPGVFETA
jgi:predicted dehydrogenase